MVLLGIEVLGHRVYPFPAGLDPNDHQALASFMKTAPLGAWLFVLAAYAVGSFAGGASGTWLGSKPWICWVTGGLFMIMGLIGLLMRSNPVWFWVVSLALYLPASWAGGRLMRRPVHS
jgi:hypothetical protein